MEQNKGLLDLTFPILSDPSKRLRPQQWFYTHYKGADTREYTPYEDWVINGQAILLLSDGTLEQYKCAQLRFGRNPSMQGFHLCLMAHFPSINDDKHEFETPHAAPNSVGLTGIVRGVACFFRVYPFQDARLRRFLSAEPDLPKLLALIGAHARLCWDILDGKQ